MLVEPINESKIRIRLSNTESVTQNIYRFRTIDNEIETKSTSSTCNYFLTTNIDNGKRVIEFIEKSFSSFVCDVSKTKRCLIEQDELINERNLIGNFKGNLFPFRESLVFFKNFNVELFPIGKGYAKIDSNGRTNLYLDSENRNSLIFRNGIIAVLSDIILEFKEDYILIYPEIKEEIRVSTTNNKVELSKEKILELSKKMQCLENEEFDTVLRELLKEGYELLTYINK